MTPGLARRLTLGLAAVYSTLGTLEVVLKISEGEAMGTIAFFGGTLLGGAGLIVCGLVARVPSTTRRVFIVLGAAAGLLASAWTVVVPVLALAVIVTQAQGPTRPNAGPASR